MTVNTSEAWTQVELAAAVSAYLSMLGRQESGQAYSKTEYRNILLTGVLSTRTKASIEFRMRNISSALSSLGLKWLQGYLPAKNVGANVLKTLLVEIEAQGFLSLESFRATAEPIELEKRTLAIQSLPLSSPPIGILTPNITQAITTVYDRSPSVRAWVLKRSKAICELCNQAAPFVKDNGLPFLEVHHVITLANGGSDSVDNCVALCPNCHRALHYASTKNILVATLYRQVSELTNVTR